MIAIYRNDVVLLIGDFSCSADFESAEICIRSRFAPKKIINLCRLQDVTTNQQRRKIIRKLLQSTVTVVYVLNHKSSAAPLIKFTQRIMLHDHDMVNIFFEKYESRNKTQLSHEPASWEETLKQNTFHCIVCKRCFPGNHDRIFCRNCRDQLISEDRSGEKMAVVYNKARPFKFDNHFETIKKIAFGDL